MINRAHPDLFHAVMRHDGMTRAAEAPGICDPHVSRAMAQFEAETSLFVCPHGTARRGASGSA